jgi:hypothetical protein
MWLAVVMVFIAFLMSMCDKAHSAETTLVYSDNQIADAIFKAENSKTHPYGILAHYKNTSPRQACLNTIAHAKRDWNGKGDFIVFLGSRYCPVGAKNDPTGLNKNWVRNVNRFLERGL